MKYKSNKLKKLEKDRFSIITTNLDKCYLCPNKTDDINEVFMGRNRQNSMKYGLCVPLCRKCHKEFHKNRDLQLQLMKIGLNAFLKEHSIDDFRDIFKYIKGLDIF